MRETANSRERGNRRARVDACAGFMVECCGEASRADDRNPTLDVADHPPSEGTAIQAGNKDSRMVEEAQLNPDLRYGQPPEEDAFSAGHTRSYK